MLFDHHQRAPHSLPLLFGAADWHHEAAFRRRALRRLCRRIREALEAWSQMPPVARSSTYLSRTLATVNVTNLGLAYAGLMTAAEAWDVSVAMAQAACDSCSSSMEAKCPA